MCCLFARDIVLYIYRREGGALNKQEYMKEYRKKLSPIRADLTIEERKELNKIDSLRLLFSMPTFVENKKDINREFKLSGSYERGLAGDKYEMKLKNELKQSEIGNVQSG